ncbi:MAG: hypothetical protein CMJ84_03425 [Planctomycetes bacterium]|jgi:hypothetical protein|nr:hypothetical protein [Planctomycetota bacterium]MDP6409098.1 glycosyltransferase family 2 protein [Planctomycetota bacterium]
MTVGDPCVHAVVVNWNGGGANLACLEGVEAQGLARDCIVFVDNGSTDGSLAEVRAAHPGLTVIENDENLGFGAAANQGARVAIERGARAVFFVNNDVVLPAGVLGRLCAALEERPRRAVVGPLVLRGDRPELVWSAGGAMTWRENLSGLRGFGRRDGPAWRESRDVDYIVGCAMLVSAELLEELDYFAVEYFAYMEDVDLCLRARCAGWEVHFVGDVAALHTPSSATGGGYSPRRKYMNAVNSVAFLRRHGRAVHWLRFLFFDVASLPVLWAIGIFRGRGKAVLAKAWGVCDGLRGRRVTAERVRDGASWLW